VIYEEAVEAEALDKMMLSELVIKLAEAVEYRKVVGAEDIEVISLLTFFCKLVKALYMLVMEGWTLSAKVLNSAIEEETVAVLLLETSVTVDLRLEET
jgi:adenine deaminase